jgi:hypothetical protein
MFLEQLQKLQKIQKKTDLQFISVAVFKYRDIDFLDDVGESARVIRRLTESRRFRWTERARMIARASSILRSPQRNF